jgi:uncharacterized membrane protein
MNGGFMTSHDHKGASGLGTAAGIGLALGAAALGAFLSTRSQPRRDHNGDSAPGFTARRNFGKYDVTGRTVTIRKPRAELFAFWRDFRNLPKVMENLESVETGEDGRSIWTIKAPGGRTVKVETQIAREVENELIAWRSVEGSEIDTEGRVSFEDAPGDRGTRVGLIIAYQPPGGELGRLLAKVFMREPAVQARHDLKRLKMLMETGEIATSANRRDQTRAAQQNDGRQTQTENA